jgi:hypothetical protein
MKMKPLLCISVCLYFFLVSCSKEVEPIRIDGTWDVTLWETGGCQDSTMNFSWDLSEMGCNVDTFINEEKCFNFVFVFDSMQRYSIEILTNNLTTGQQSQSMTTGVYDLVNNNTLSMCGDMECDTLTIIRQGLSLDMIVKTDTITGCGVHYFANKID